MDRIGRHLQYLASRHDCVIIPGVGGILATQKHATFDEGDCIVPPQRTFTFNSALRHNDGLLACSVSRAESVSYETAMQLIADEVKILLRQLDRDGEYPLGRVGYLSGSSSEYKFTPYPAENLSVSTLWLPRVQTQAGIEERESSVSSAPPCVRHHNRLREFIRAAAVIIAVLGFYCIMSTPIAVDDTVYASLAPEIKKLDAADLHPAVVGDKADVSADAVIWGNEDETLPLVETVDVSTEIECASVVPDEANHVDATDYEMQEATYFIIVASLSSVREADDFLAIPSNGNLHLLQSDGRCRIYISSHSSASEAGKALKDVREKYPTAWIYSK